MSTRSNWRPSTISKCPHMRFSRTRGKGKKSRSRTFKPLILQPRHNSQASRRSAEHVSKRRMTGIDTGIELFLRYSKTSAYSPSSWVDTCCIDKSSSAELSEAINSMYRWYNDAQICYAYLADISKAENLKPLPSSRWFTRGWTLQVSKPEMSSNDDGTDGKICHSEA